MKDFEFSIDFLGFWPGCRARTWTVQGHAPAHPCTDPQEYLMVQGHSSDFARWPRCGPLEWPCTKPLSGHWSGPAPSGIPVDRCRGMSLHGASSGPAPRPKSPKVDRKFKILHETGIRSTKNADFLPFGYSFERRIDLEGSWSSNFGQTTGRCRATPVTRNQVGAGPLQ